MGIETSRGVCKGLKDAVDDHASSIVEHSEDTHPDVIVTGARVIKGFDEGCKN